MQLALVADLWLPSRRQTLPKQPRTVSGTENGISQLNPYLPNKLTWEEFLMKGVFFAGGLGSRLSEETTLWPKSMVEKFHF